MAGRYLELPADVLLRELHAIGAAIEKQGGQKLQFTMGNEIVIALAPPNRRTGVRIFTSLSAGSSKVRAKGRDAVRIVWGFRKVAAGGDVRQAEFKPLAGARQLNRTAPASLPEPARQEAFLGRLRDAVRDAYRAALRAPQCPLCKAPMVERTGRNGVFLGCADYPHCTGSSNIPKTVTSGSERGRIVARGDNGVDYPRGLPGHATVARYGLPNGEHANEQVEDGLQAELEGATYFDVAPEGGSRLSRLLTDKLRGQR